MDCGCGLRGIVARIHSADAVDADCQLLWLAGNRRSDTLRMTQTFTVTLLWLAGNRRSDTLD